MPITRRFFLNSTCFSAVGAALAGAPSLDAAGFTKTLPAPLPVETAEEPVIAFLRQYAGHVLLVGSGVLAKERRMAPRSLHFLISVPDFSVLVVALGSALPFPVQGSVFAVGNTLSFTSGGIDFTIENLTPADYASRVAGLAKVRNIAFAQDALSYQPGSQEVSDPFLATRRTSLAVINTTLAGASAMDATLRGTAEAQSLGLTLPAGFTTWHRRALGLNIRAKDAAAFAGTLLRRLASTADKLPPEAFAPILLSRSAASALKQVFGTDTAAAVQRFQQLRPTLDGSVGNSALWLAVLLGAALAGGGPGEAALSWVQGGTPSANARAAAALAQARQLMTLPSFQTI